MRTQLFAIIIRFFLVLENGRSKRAGERRNSKGLRGLINCMRTNSNSPQQDRDNLAIHSNKLNQSREN